MKRKNGGNQSSESIHCELIKYEPNRPDMFLVRCQLLYHTRDGKRNREVFATDHFKVNDEKRYHTKKGNDKSGRNEVSTFVLFLLDKIIESVAGGTSTNTDKGVKISSDKKERKYLEMRCCEQ